MVEITEDEYNDYLKLKEMKHKQDLSKKKHFIEKKKDAYRYCEVCDKDIKYGSYINHIRSKKHISVYENKNNIE